MCNIIDREIVAAHLRGERDLVETLKGFELTPASNGIVHSNNLNENQLLGYHAFERRLRDAAVKYAQDH